MYSDNGVRFSPSFLVEKWGVENGRESAPRVKKMKMNRESEQKEKSRSRKYKGQSGRISRDGKSGYYDVDSRGRTYCV
jgi:hypothetical protein